MGIQSRRHRGGRAAGGGLANLAEPQRRSASSASRRCANAPATASPWWLASAGPFPLALLVTEASAVAAATLSGPRATGRGRADHAGGQSRRTVPAAARRRPETRRARRRRSTPSRRRTPSASRRRGGRGSARRTRASRRSATGWRRSHVGARAERDRAQHRGPHPALQRAGDAAPAQAASRAARRPGKAHERWSGLGRSIFAIFDRNLIIHALDSYPRSASGEGARGPVASFVATSPAATSSAGSAGPRVLGSRRLWQGGRRVRAFRFRAPAPGRHHAQASRAAIAATSLLQTLTPRARAPRLPTCAPRSRRSRRFRTWTKTARPLHRHHQRRGANSLRERARPARSANSPIRCAPSGRSRTCAARTSSRPRVAGSKRRLALPSKLEAVDESVWLNVDSYSLMQAHQRTSCAGCATSSGSARSASGSTGAGRARASRPSSGRVRRWVSRRTMAWQTDAMELGGRGMSIDAASRSSSGTARRSGTRSTSLRSASTSASRIPQTRPEETPWSCVAERREPARVLRLRPVPPAAARRPSSTACRSLR